MSYQVLSKVLLELGVKEAWNVWCSQEPFLTTYRYLC